MYRLLVFAMCFAGTAHAAAPGFQAYTSFPNPAPGSFTVSGTALPDGRLALWNGDTVFFQFAPNADHFMPVASGYAGDPAFIVLSPDEQYLLLGGGFNGLLYRLDWQAPQDFVPTAIVANAPHFGGDFLNDSLLLVDTTNDDFSGSEMRIVNLDGAKRVSRAVVTGKPVNKAVVEKPPFTFSASVYVDRQAGIAWCTSSFGTPEEIRYFSIAELVQAFENITPLDWTTDGTRIGAAGQFNGGGVAGETAAGELIVGGNGSVQLVDPRLDNPALASVTDAFDPTGAGGFYTAFNNSHTGVITFYGENNVAYVQEGILASVPLASGTVLAALAGAFAVLMVRRRARA